MASQELKINRGTLILIKSLTIAFKLSTKSLHNKEKKTSETTDFNFVLVFCYCNC